MNFPVVARDDMGDGARMNSEALTQVNPFDTGSEGSYFSYIVPVQLGSWSPLGVDRTRDSFEVIDVDARTDATGVVKFKSFGDGSMDLLPEPDVSGLLTTSSTRYPVTTIVLGASPDMAPVSINNEVVEGPSSVVTWNVTMSDFGSASTQTQLFWRHDDSFHGASILAHAHGRAQSI